SSRGCTAASAPSSAPESRNPPKIPCGSEPLGVVGSAPAGRMRKPVGRGGRNRDRQRRQGVSRMLVRLAVISATLAAVLLAPSGAAQADNPVLVATVGIGDGFNISLKDAS